jgi:hypothetical protein
MANLFQQTFRNVRASNNVLLGPPPLQPAPTAPLPTLQRVQPLPTPPLPVLHAAPPPAASTNTTIEFINSTRGKPKLLHDGYTYVYHKDRSNGNVAWRCDLNNKASRDKGISCSSTAVTTGTSSSSSLEYAKPHSHPPAPGRVGAYKVRNVVKTAASTHATAKPHLIVASSLSNLPADVHQNLNRSNLKRSIQRTRKKDALSTTPDLALACDRSLILLYIPTTLLQSWVHFDSGPGSDRIFILTTDSNLDLMRRSPRLCGDGTFKAAPKLWTQLYTIHGMKNGYTVPCVYALLPDKRKETYTRLFRQIKFWLDVAGQQWEFDSFLCDYEQGAYLAMTDVFPGVGTDGCFFHLCKRLDVHVKQQGLMPKYTADLDFRIRVKQLAALAFIPVADVIPVFESLATTFHNDELVLLSYFESTWIGRPVPGGRRLPPLFPLHMWNLLDRSSTGSTRTTNALEAFHHTFNSLISCQHPTIWNLLPALEKQQNLTDNTIQHINRGDTFRPSAKEAARNARIVGLISSYTRPAADTFLRSIAYNYMS